MGSGSEFLTFFLGRKATVDGRALIIACLWMPFSGWREEQRLGVICRQSLGTGAQLTRASVVGPSQAYGRIFSKSYVKTLTLNTF